MHSQGDKYFIHPFNLPADAKHIRFGNNVVCASGVTVGPNAAIAVGSVVNKEVPEGKLLVVFPPERSAFADLTEKRNAHSATEFSGMNQEDRLAFRWKDK